jgi:hypothetical protein
MGVAFVALLLALCGTAIALPGRNTVDSGDIKKSGVRSGDIAKNAVTGSKVKNNSLKGADVLESSLGTVPSAASAGSANTANTANTATEVAPSEPYHHVGAPGEPAFTAGCSSDTTGSPDSDHEPVGFYKDKLGVVHLTGVLECTGSDLVAFRLPPGYRPADHRFLIEVGYCGSCPAGTAPLYIYGNGNPDPSLDGGLAVLGTPLSLDGMTFRAGG